MKNESAPLFEKPIKDYLRLMTASPEVGIADPVANQQAIALAYQQAKVEQAELLVLPELCVTGYSAADLFFNRHVLNRTLESLQALAAMTENGPAVVVGAPLAQDNLLYNCAVILAEGRIQGVVPKTYIPNSNEFYEKRWFRSGKNVIGRTMQIGEDEVPFGTDLLFNINGTKVGIEICEDGWAGISPGSHAALQGAEVIVNLSASNELTGKEDYRRTLVTGHAARLLCAYAYTSAGKGESHADTIYSGHQIISENGAMLGEVKPFGIGALVTDIDREYLATDRLVSGTWADEVIAEQERMTYRTVKTQVPRPTDNRLLREVNGRPYDTKANTVKTFRIMTEAMVGRIQDVPGTRGIVLGLSGGRDSTLALIAAVEAAKKLGKPASFIHTITMPGLASSEATQDLATQLAHSLGTTHSIIPISELSHSLLAAIGHDGVTEDITYENTQARTRTEILMNYANKIGGFVQGTGDMSELAQGYCTYNGDQMSMYNLNGNVYKTMADDLIWWYADELAGPETKKVIQKAMELPASAELKGGDLSQVTEDIVGPYELHAFFQTELQRHRSTPNKMGYVASKAKFRGTYSQEEILRWRDAFLDKFTSSQWKREVMPNGPMIGPVGVSPRGPLRMAPNTSPNWYR